MNSAYSYLALYKGNLMESKPKTLREILDLFSYLDDDLPPEDFDPALVVGDVKDKVDAIKWRIDQWEAEAQAIKDGWIKQLTAKANALLAKKEKLGAYLKEQMIAHEFEKLPGHMFTASIRKNPPSVKLTTEATADLYLDFPELVEELPVEYRFRKDKIKEELKAGKVVPFARLEQGQRVEFKVKEGEK